MKTAAPTSWEVLAAQKSPRSSGSEFSSSSSQDGGDLWTLLTGTPKESVDWVHDQYWFSARLPHLSSQRARMCTQSGKRHKGDLMRALLDSNEEQGGLWEGTDRGVGGD